MTMKERNNPSLLNASRRKRIAAGSGTTVQMINQLMKQYEQTAMMMKKFSGGAFKKQMGGLPGGRFNTLGKKGRFF